MSESLSIAIADRSISSTFQSKQQLFLTAPDLYDERCGDKVLASLTAAEAGLLTLKLFCDSRTTQADQGNRMSCFMCNSTVERSLVNPEIGGRVRGQVNRLEEAFHTALQNARKSGEIKGKPNLRTVHAI